MKKNLLVFLATLFAFSSAMSQIAFQEDFSGGSLPTGWTTYSPSNDVWFFGGSVDFGSTSAVRVDAKGNQGEYARIDFSNDPDTTAIITPIINVASLPNPTLYFSYNSQTTRPVGFHIPWNMLIVDYWNGSSWVNIGVIDSLTQPAGSVNVVAGWKEYVIDASSYIFNVDKVQFRFSAQEGGPAAGGTGSSSTFDQDMMLDDVQVRELITCPEPLSSTLGSFNLTSSSADVYWTENGSATNWQIEYGPSGFTAGSGTKSLESNDTASITGLNPATVYDFYVRSICAAGDTSTWTGPHTFSTSCLAGLSGNYTINPASATGGTNFSSFSDFFNLALNCGLDAATTVDVVAGTGPYVLNVDVPAIPGASSANTLTLNGNGNVINHGGGGYFIALNGVKHLTINDFMFVNETPNTQKFGIMMRGSCDSNNITNNTINMGTGYTNSNSGCIVASNSLTSPSTAGFNASNTLIDNNTLIGAYYGIRLNGPTSGTRPAGNIITNNTFEDFYLYGFYNSYTNNFVAKNNDISRATRSTISTFYGIYSTRSINDTIMNNKIHDGGIGAYTNYAIYITNSSNSAASHFVIANNAIYNNNTTSTQYPIYLQGTLSYFDVHHNTIDINTDGGTGTIRGIYVSSTPNNLNLTNNMVSVKGNGTGTKVCYYSNSSTTFTGSNNLFHMGATAGTNNNSYYSGNQSTIADWDLATSTGGNSDADPLFNPGSFTPTTAIADNGGTPLAAVTSDINGVTRSTTTPDYGALEFAPPTCPVSINLLGFNPTGTTHEVTWTPGAADVSWRVEYGPAGFTRGSGTIVPSANDTLTITGLSTTTDYEFYVQGICGAGDSSIWVGPGSFRTVCLTSLSGTITVDPSMPASATNFVTTDSLFQTLEDCGISGPTTVNFATGSGPYVFNWDLDGVPGLGTTNTLTFNGNGVTVNRGPGTYFLALNGITHLTIENFEFINETPNTARFGIMMRGGCDSITIKNNTINMGTGYTSSLSCGVCASNTLTSATTAGDNANNVTIDSNTIIGAYYGVSLRGLGTGAGARSVGHRVTNNTFQDQSFYGLYSYASDDILISNNDISRSTRTNSSSFYGIYNWYSTSSVYTNNRVHAVQSVSTCYPMYLGYNTNSALMPGIIANNAIYDISSTGTFYGIYLYSFTVAATGGNDYINIWHNTVTRNTTGTSSTTRGISVNTTNATYINNIDLTNNLVDIYGTGSGTKYAVYFPTVANFSGSNNVLYNGATAGNNNLGYFGANRATLAAWNTASGQTNNSDANPIIVAPNFIPFSNVIDDFATPLALVPTDIDGVVRNTTTPDVGALEFVPTGGDLAIIDGGLRRVSDCYGTTDTAFVDITNLFGDTIDFTTTPLTVYFDVTGPINTTVTTVINTDSLLVGDTLKIINTNIDMSVPGKYSITAYIDFALNNILDINDSLISIDEVDVKPILAVTPEFDTLYSLTDSTKLTSSSPFYAGGSFLITEVCHFKTTTGAPLAWPSYLTADDYLEITGVPGSDLAGYTLEQWGTSGLNSSVTFPSGTVMSPNGTAIFMLGQSATASQPSNFYYDARGGSTTTYSSSTQAGRVLKDPSGTIVDAHGYNGFTFPAAAAVSAADWSASLVGGGSTSGQRLTGADVNSGTNWVVSSATNRQDPGTLNAGVSLPVSSAVAGITWTDLTTSTVLPDTTPEIQVKGIFTANGTYPIEVSFVTPCGTYRDTSYITLYNQTYDTTIINECDSFVLPLSGATYYATGFYIDTLSSTGTTPAYDSIFYVYDVNIDTTNETFTLVECDSFVSPSGKTWNVSGTYFDTITNSLGCDSLMVFNLTVNFSSTGMITTTECDTFIAPSGAVLRTTGMYMDTIINNSGCDSVITINLTILNSTTSTVSPIVCDSLVSPTGKVWNTSGVFTDTLTNSIGCDSVIVFNLTVNYSVVRTDNIVLCIGQTHRVGPNVYTTAGTYTDLFATIPGCDSTIITNLSFHAPATATVNYNFCTGDSVQILGNWYFAATTFTDTAFAGSSNGCDSVTTHVLTTRTVTPALDLGNDVVACLDGGVTIFASNAYTTYNWSNGGTTNVLSSTGAIAGVGTTNYVLTVTQASTGCTATDDVNITYNNCVGLNEVDADLNVNLYPNPATNFVTIEIFDKYNSNDLTLEILNSLGQIVESRKVTTANEKVIMDVNNFSKGLYLVRLSSDKLYITKKLLIQK
ncbi:MAG: T9SS type A sorting domain-containing protein [Flavobacteriales bacterium]